MEGAGLGSHSNPKTGTLLKRKTDRQTVTEAEVRHLDVDGLYKARLGSHSNRWCSACWVQMAEKYYKSFPTMPCDANPLLSP